MADILNKTKMVQNTDNRLEQVKSAYRKATENYTKELISAIRTRVEDSLGEYGLPSTDEDKIAYGDPVISGRPTDVYIATDGEVLTVEIIPDNEPEYTEDDVRVDSLPVESMEKILELLKRPLDEDEEE